MENKDQRLLIVFSGSEDSGKSISLKSLIFELAKDEKTRKCEVKLADLPKKYEYSKKVDYSNISDRKGFEDFLNSMQLDFVDIANSAEKQALFEECIRRKFKAIRKKYELDFVALIEIEVKIDVRIKVAVCTIGDDEEKIRLNVCDGDDLKQVFRDVDVLICASRPKSCSDGSFGFLESMSQNQTNGFTFLRVDVKRKKKEGANSERRRIF